jgi:hypothetical protein
MTCLLMMVKGYIGSLSPETKTTAHLHSFHGKSCFCHSLLVPCSSLMCTG